ncbi:MAG: GtrA family protein [Chitinophagaceae bacterium]
MRRFLNAFISFFYFDFISKWLSFRTFKYLYCGSLTAFTDLVVYYIAYNFILEKQEVKWASATLSAPIAAFIISFSVSFPMGFFLNKYIVFTESELKGRIQLFRYGVSVLVSIALSYLSLKVLIEFFGVYPTISKFLTTVFVALCSYFLQQYYSFKVKSIGQKL